MFIAVSEGRSGVRTQLVNILCEQKAILDFDYAMYLFYMSDFALVVYYYRLSLHPLHKHLPT